MIIANVKFEKIEVKNFSAKEGVDLNIYFDDGNKKMIVHRSNLKNIELTIDEIMKRIRNHEKEISAKFDGENVLESSVVIRIENEDEVAKKMGSFFLKVYESMQKIVTTKSSEGFLDMINKINRMSFEF